MSTPVQKPTPEQYFADNRRALAKAYHMCRGDMRQFAGSVARRIGVVDENTLEELTGKYIRTMS